MQELWALGSLTGHIPTENIKFRDLPYTSMCETTDFRNFVLHGDVSVRQWIKDFKGCKFTYLYDKDDTAPMYSFLLHFAGRGGRMLLNAVNPVRLVRKLLK